MRIATIISYILIVFMMGMLIYSEETGPSAVSKAYFQELSSTKTIGEAFDQYFEDGQWRRYQSDGRDFCEYKGSHPIKYSSIQEIQITFEMKDEKFKINKILVNGNKTDPDGWEMIMKMIYGYY